MRLMRDSLQPIWCQPHSQALVHESLGMRLIRCMPHMPEAGDVETITDHNGKDGNFTLADSFRGSTHNESKLGSKATPLNFYVLCIQLRIPLLQSGVRASAVAG